VTGPKGGAPYPFHAPHLSHTLPMPHTPPVHVHPLTEATQLPRAFTHWGLIAKWEVNIKNQLSKLTTFYTVPEGFSWGIPGSPAGVMGLNPWPSLPKC